MRFRRSRRPDEQATERLLAAAAAPHADESPDPVVRLLAAASAPAGPGDLAGEEAALAAFRAARTERPAPTAGRPRRRRTVGTLAWVAGVAVTATAGVAVATVGLDRPDPASTPPPATGTPGTPPTGQSTDPSGPSPSAGTAAPTPTPTSGTAGPGRDAGRATSAVPASLPGLCNAYLAQPDRAERGRSLRSPAFRALVDAAGGPAQVEEYCRDLASERTPPAAPPSAGPPTRPSTVPSAHPSAPGRPTGPPGSTHGPAGRP
ncbi:hypothetical protein [Micromonospora cathayae]|uniref:Uncharacterized protein n=1 Tax=Micromonospora cathayae TaxID=3028804 RepID=A0ABY7ZJD9_9ACTN|nr:hypothetical protein [Micromonospora sp. HUAS 3]WDZ83061.1 hypothetical protein PVK37_21655 [Micromonospora sp. HUAS 3]